MASSAALYASPLFVIPLTGQDWQSTTLAVRYRRGYVSYMSFSGGWNDRHRCYSYGYRYDQVLHIELGVRPAAMNHSVGVVYSWQEWHDQHWGHGKWLRNEGDEEIWTVPVYYLTHGLTEYPPPKIWFAVYAEQGDGHKVWDNNDGWNYELLHSTLQSTAVRVGHNVDGTKTYYPGDFDDSD